MRTQAQVLECIEKAFENPTKKALDHALEDIDYYVTDFMKLLSDKRHLLVALYVDLESKGELV